MACGVFAYRGSGSCVDGTRPSVGRRADPSVGVSANRSRAPGHTAGTTNTISLVGECVVYETLRLHHQPG